MSAFCPATVNRSDAGGASSENSAPSLVSPVERQEQCVRCQQWTSDWVDTEQTKGRCCRTCESIILSSVERDAQKDL